MIIPVDKRVLIIEFPSFVSLNFLDRERPVLPCTVSHEHSAAAQWQKFFHGEISSYLGVRHKIDQFMADASVDEAKQRLRECWLWSRAYTVSGGSSEMMRNILAKRRLALPSG